MAKYFWLPLFLGLVPGTMAAIDINQSGFAPQNVAAILGSATLLLISAWPAGRQSKNQLKAGDGGLGFAKGRDSDAMGGDGGSGPGGGKGGDATAIGNSAKARGGRGGEA